MEEGYSIPILDHGYLKLLKWLGDDAYIAETARVSTQSISKSLNLVARLIKDRHSSPLEFGIIQFEIKAPLFVFREWHRHRTQSYSELSARFGELPMDFYLPSLERMNPQHATNKQMSDETQIIGNASLGWGMWNAVVESITKIVEDFRTEFPLTRELAQRLYPQNRYTICRASGNLWNWMHFLTLRCASDAQYEIRQYAWQVHAILKELFPVAIEAWEEYIFYSVTLSRTEKETLKNYLKSFIPLVDTVDAPIKSIHEKLTV